MSTITKIYLAGLISTNKPDSLAWRAAVKDWASVRSSRPLGPTIVILDPLRGKGDLSKSTSDGGITTGVATARDIMRRDYNDVVSCDVLLVHLDDFGSTRPMLGTPMELGWAWEHHKPVVAVAAKENYLMRNHPMVSEAVSRYFETVGAAWEFILRYYLKP